MVPLFNPSGNLPGAGAIAATNDHKKRPGSSPRPFFNAKLAPDNEQAKQVIAYYEVNTNRMNYKYYKTIGAGIISSGAIESAHRTVVQKRMKLSGQRWSVEGAQNMLNLMVTYMNERWDNVIYLTKNNFKKQKLKPTG